MSAKRYYVVEQRGMPIDVSSSWARANELALQYGTKQAPTTVVEVEALQQELPTPKKPYCVNENYEVGSGKVCECGNCKM